MSSRLRGATRPRLSEGGPRFSWEPPPIKTALAAGCRVVNLDARIGSSRRKKCYCFFCQCSPTHSPTRPAPPAHQPTEPIYSPYHTPFDPCHAVPALYAGSSIVIFLALPTFFGQKAGVSQLDTGERKERLVLPLVISTVAAAISNRKQTKPNRDCT